MMKQPENDSDIRDLVSEVVDRDDYIEARQLIASYYKLTGEPTPYILAEVDLFDSPYQQDELEAELEHNKLYVYPFGWEPEFSIP